MNLNNKSECILFSIIVPVYNVEKYIEQCIQSILNQSEHSYEIIIVDDGSTDRSGEICDLYAENNSDIIRVIHKDNNGLISARRVGLQKASGEYIVFVDSDDYLSENALKQLKDIVEREKSDIIVYRWNRIDEYGSLIPNNEPPIFPEGTVRKEDFIRELLKMSKLNSLCLKACRYAIYDVDESYEHYYSVGNGEDLLQTIPLVMGCQSIYYSLTPIYNYRANQEGYTHTFRKSRCLVLSQVAPKLYYSVQALGFMDVENNKIFFTAYNSIIWNLCLQLNGSNFQYKEKEKIYYEISKYEFVVKAKSFYNNNKELFTILYRVGLNCFYKSWKLCFLYFFIISQIRSVLLLFRDFVRKIRSYKKY